MELDIGSARCFISTRCTFKILGACHIDHSKWSILAAHRDTLRHTIHQGVSSASISEKRRRRKNREAAAANHDRLSSAAAASGPARHALGSPVTNAPAVDVDHPKQANPSYDDNEDIILIIAYNSPHLNHAILISVKFAWLSFQCEIYERKKSLLHLKLLSDLQNPTFYRRNITCAEYHTRKKIKGHVLVKTSKEIGCRAR